MGNDGHLDYQPRLFPSVNGPNSPPITSIHSVFVETDYREQSNDNNSSSFTSKVQKNGKKKKYLCATGAKDGSVTTFYLDEL